MGAVNEQGFEQTTSSSSSEVIRVPTLDYLNFFKLSFETTGKYWRRFQEKYAHNYSFPASFYDDIRQSCSIRLFDLVLVFSLAIFWTCIRSYLSNRYFLPYARKCRLSPTDCAKVPESIWKLLFYSFSWSVSVYVVWIQGKYCFFNDPLCIWEKWYPLMDVPYDICLMYLVQGSFYVHSLYATVFMDCWRKDSIVMILHHFLTLALIGFSYGARHHYVGALVLLFHDVTDIELEFTKLNIYYKNRGGKFYSINDHLSTIGFTAFAVCWFWFRLYWYPLKVMYTGLYGSYHMAPENAPFIPLFNGMLWLLLVLNIYWFHYIVCLAYRILTGQTREIDDMREYDADGNLKEKVPQNQTDQNGCVTNGEVSKEKRKNKAE